MKLLRRHAGLLAVAAVLVTGILFTRAWLQSTPAPSLQTNNVKGTQAAAVEVEEWGDFG